MFKNISFFIIIVLFSVAVSVNAQDSTSLAGKYALQFQVSQNFTLSNFLGSVISGKYHFTNESSIRVGLGFSTNMDNRSSKDQYNLSPSIDDRVYETKSQSLNLVVQYMVAPVLTDNIRFYCGIGPKWEVGYSKISSGQSDFTNGIHYYNRINRTSNDYSIGLLCSAGVEWFFTKKMSLCAEYGLSYAYSYSKINDDRFTSYYNTSDLKVYNYTFSADNVRFGLSVYF